MTKQGQKNMDEGKFKITMLIVGMSGVCTEPIRFVDFRLKMQTSDYLKKLLFCFLYFSDHTEKNYLTMLQNIFIKPCSRQRYDAKVPYLIFDSFFKVYMLCIP